MKTGISLVICLALFSITLFAKGQEAPPDFQPPQVISTVEPSYPANTVAGGTVVLTVTVSPSGEIEDVQVLQGAKGFTQQAKEAIRKWKFKPASLDGKPVAASIPVAFSFSQPIVWWNRKGK
jgi:periplasmic protein TonB